MIERPSRLPDRNAHFTFRRQSREQVPVGLRSTCESITQKHLRERNAEAHRLNTDLAGRTLGRADNGRIGRSGR
jgi:hypothetical protein